LFITRLRIKLIRAAVATGNVIRFENIAEVTDVSITIWVPSVLGELAPIPAIFRVLCFLKKTRTYRKN
jgi:hypothetical protein